MFFTPQLVKALQLPEDPLQCVHAEVNEHGVAYCERRTAHSGPNGWVCLEHQPKPPVVKAPPRNLDQEIVESIIKTDAKAIEIERLKAMLLSMGNT